MAGTRNPSAPGRPRTALAAVLLTGLALLATGGPAASAPAATVASRAGVGAEAVPILLYHHVSAPSGKVRSRALWVSGSLFRRHIAALAHAGYHGVTLAQVWRHWQQGADLPAKPIVVSFDDGYGSQYANARPVLARQGWPGVLNQQVARIGVPGGLTRAQLRRLVRAGWEIDDHSVTHPDLTRVGAAVLGREVAGSKATLEAELGVPVAFFCYPYGHYDARVEAAVRDAGFLAATTTERGLASPTDDPYALNRIIASGTTSPSELVRLVRRAR